MKESLELFLLNTTKTDVSLSDLGVKVPAGKTINIFKANPYLTSQQVEKSKQDGALSKRLAGGNPVLKIVKRASLQNSKIINKLKESTEPINIKKTKSSIVIEIPNDKEQEDKLEFADYGVIDFEPVKNQDAIFITAREENLNSNDTKSTTELKATVIENKNSNQPTIIMNTENKPEVIKKEEPLTMSFVAPKQKNDIIETAAKVVKEKDNVVKVKAKGDSKKKKNNILRKDNIEFEDDPSILEEVSNTKQTPIKVENAVILEPTSAENK